MVTLESYYLLVFCPRETKKPIFSLSFPQMRTLMGKSTTSTLTPKSEKCHLGDFFQFPFPSKTPLSLLLPPHGLHWGDSGAARVDFCFLAFPRVEGETII